MIIGWRVANVIRRCEEVRAEQDQVRLERGLLELRMLGVQKRIIKMKGRVGRESTHVQLRTEMAVMARNLRMLVGELTSLDERRMGVRTGEDASVKKRMENYHHGMRRVALLQLARVIDGDDADLDMPRVGAPAGDVTSLKARVESYHRSMRLEASLQLGRFIRAFRGQACD